jgi:hypothetical protein
MNRFWASKLYTTRFMFVDEQDHNFCALIRLLTLCAWLGWTALNAATQLKIREFREDGI